MYLLLLLQDRSIECSERASALYTLVQIVSRQLFTPYYFDFFSMPSALNIIESIHTQG